MTFHWLIQKHTDYQTNNHQPLITLNQTVQIFCASSIRSSQRLQKLYNVELYQHTIHLHLIITLPPVIIPFKRNLMKSIASSYCHQIEYQTQRSPTLSKLYNYFCLVGKIFVLFLFMLVRSMSHKTKPHSWTFIADLLRWNSLTMSYISSPSVLCFTLSFVLIMANNYKHHQRS